MVSAGLDNHTPQSGLFEFWASEPSQQVHSGDWKICIYANAQLLIATFVFPSEAVAREAHQMIQHVLRKCSFIDTGREGIEARLQAGASEVNAIAGYPNALFPDFR
jgi:hypothetical protein